MKRLNQVIAGEAALKGAVQGRITALHRNSGQPDLYVGITKSYKPLQDGGETLPDEVKRMQLNVNSQLKDAIDTWTTLFDVTFTKDKGNQEAVADVIVDGNTVLKDVPVTFLLFLEKRLQDITSFV